MADYHTGSISIDEAEGLIEAEATFEIQASWSHRRGNGYRSINYISGVQLTSWNYGGRKQTRETAVALAGEAWVAAQEEHALAEWHATAEQDDADGYADYARDMAMD